MIEIVAATRLTEAAFRDEAPFAQSPSRVSRDKRIKPAIAFGNARGLPEIYNARIDAAGPDDVLVFIHDDVWPEDFYFVDLSSKLSSSSTLSASPETAGALQRRAAGPMASTASWIYPIFVGLSRMVRPRWARSGFFGPIVGECELLDGVFLATKAGSLRRAKVRFDARFAFHHYDLDFCRTARVGGLRLGTWPIAMTHRSAGNPHTESWNAALALYRAKWLD